jgi:hypothetical protein
LRIYFSELAQVLAHKLVPVLQNALPAAKSAGNGGENDGLARAGWRNRQSITASVQGFY